MSHTQFDESYYRSNGQFGDRPALRYYTRLVRRFVDGGPLLDFGCGTGHLVRHLSAVAAADGFEVSEYSAATARATSSSSTVYTDIGDVPGNRYRGLTAIHVLEHLSDDVVASSLAQWQRILQPGGRALVVTPDLAGFGRALAQDAWNGFSDPTHINLKTHAGWKQVLQGAGFDIVAEGSDGLWNVPYGRAPKLIDAVHRGMPALAQFLSGRLFLRPGTGESSIFVIARAG